MYKDIENEKHNFKMKFQEYNMMGKSSMPEYWKCRNYARGE